MAKDFRVSEEKITDLKPHTENANLGNPRGQEMVLNSIQECGFGRSIVVDKENNIIAGNTTTEKLVEAELEDAIVIESDGTRPIVHRRIDLDLYQDEKAQKLAHYDNRTSEVNYTPDIKRIVDLAGKHDLRKMYSAEEIQRYIALANTPQNPGDLGKDQKDADDLSKKAGKGELKAGCKKGEIYQLGNHRLAIGDFRDHGLMEKLMDGSADLIITDPPFNTGIQQGRTSSDWGVIENDAMPPEEFGKFAFDIFASFDLYGKRDAHVYVCCDWKSYPVFHGVGWRSHPNALIVWVKNNFGLGHGYRPQHELIIFWGSLDSTTESNVWQIAKDAASEYQHPTQKPVELFQRGILNSSKPGDTVLDFFGGSGTALIACQANNRICRTCEIDPVWATVILERFKSFTGIEPELI